MFTGRIARTLALAVICFQLIASVFVAALIPSPQSVARASEPSVQLEASDLPVVGGVEADVALERVESAPQISEPAEPADAVQGTVMDGDGHEGASDALAMAPMTGESEDVVAPSADGCTDLHRGEVFSSEQLRTAGVLSDGTTSYTWYSQRVLPGGGLQIEGRHVSDEGYVVDSQERIVVASSDLPWGTEVSVPFGTGTAVVLDTGCAPGIIDIYTDFS